VLRFLAHVVDKMGVTRFLKTISHLPRDTYNLDLQEKFKKLDEIKAAREQSENKEEKDGEVEEMEEPDLETVILGIVKMH
jgi:hypothetical protein